MSGSRGMLPPPFQLSSLSEALDSTSTLNTSFPSPNPNSNPISTSTPPNSLPRRPHSHFHSNFAGSTDSARRHTSNSRFTASGLRFGGGSPVTSAATTAAAASGNSTALLKSELKKQLGEGDFGGIVENIKDALLPVTTTESDATTPASNNGGNSNQGTIVNGLVKATQLLHSLFQIIVPADETGLGDRVKEIEVLKKLFGDHGLGQVLIDGMKVNASTPKLLKILKPDPVTPGGSDPSVSPLSSLSKLTHSQRSELKFRTKYALICLKFFRSVLIKPGPLNETKIGIDLGRLIAENYNGCVMDWMGILVEVTIKGAEEEELGEAEAKGKVEEEDDEVDEKKKAAINKKNDDKFEYSSWEIGPQQHWISRILFALWGDFSIFSQLDTNPFSKLQSGPNRSIKLMIRLCRDAIQANRKLLAAETFAPNTSTKNGETTKDVEKRVIKRAKDLRCNQIHWTVITFSQLFSSRAGASSRRNKTRYDGGYQTNIDPELFIDFCATDVGKKKEKDLRTTTAEHEEELETNNGPREFAKLMMGMFEILANRENLTFMFERTSTPLHGFLDVFLVILAYIQRDAQAWPKTEATKKGERFGVGLLMNKLIPIALGFIRVLQERENDGSLLKARTMIDDYEDPRVGEIVVIILSKVLTQCPGRCFWERQLLKVKRPKPLRDDDSSKIRDLSAKSKSKSPSQQSPALFFDVVLWVSEKRNKIVIPTQQN